MGNAGAPGAPRRPPRLTRGADGAWVAEAYLGYDRVRRAPIRRRRTIREARTEEDARRVADEWARGLGAVAGVSPDLSSMLAWHLRGLEGAAAANTLAAYGRAAARLAPLVGGVDYDALTPADVESARRELSRRYSPATVAQTLSCLSSLYRRLAALRLVGSNPAAGVARGARPEPGGERALVGDDLARLVSFLAGLLGAPAGAGRVPGTRRVYATAALVSLYAGLRVGEVCALRLRDVSASRAEVSVRGTVVEGPGGAPVRQPRPKSARSSRRVAVPAALADVLAGYLAWRPSWAPGRAAPSDPLLCDARGRALSPHAASRWLHRQAEALGLPPGTRWHDLRHTYATLLLDAGENIRVVQDMMGHADARTTLAIYADALPGAGRAAAERLGAELDGMGLANPLPRT